MDEKILFKANIVYTKEKMVQYLKSKFVVDDSMFWGFLMFLYGFISLIGWDDLFLGIMFLLIGLSAMIIEYNNKPKIEAEKFVNMTEEQYHMKEIKQEVSFTDNSIKIKSLTSWANSEMFYSQIIKLVDKKWFYGLIFRYTNIFIDKDCFTEWNKLEFKEFINQKLKEQKWSIKTNKKLNIAFRASVIFLIILFGLIIFFPDDTKDESEQNYASIDQIYQTLSIEDSKIAEWYSIPIEFLEKYPDVVSLILNSMSLENIEEKQKWFDIFYDMNDEQINELRNILTREKEKLTEIEEKYNEEVSRINEDYDNSQENT